MARIRSRTLPQDKAAGDELIEPIVKALKGEPQSDEPVIFEVPLGKTDTLQVIVVWKRWAELPPKLRTRIVVEAYQQLGAGDPGEVHADRLSMVFPVTLPEAMDLGILPYVIRSDVQRTQPEYATIQFLLKKEGAIKTGAGTELRLPTLAMARAARDRLDEAARNLDAEVNWVIDEQVSHILDD